MDLGVLWIVVVFGFGKSCPGKVAAEARVLWVTQRLRNICMSAETHAFKNIHGCIIGRVTDWSAESSAESTNYRLKILKKKS